MLSSEYIESERREYSLYILTSRAIPHCADGLKAAARRVLWVARDGKKHKSATLAGAAIPLHPHAPPESTINTLAAPYGNNIRLLSGEGAFGTLLNPTAYGASRYTAVKVSQFTKDVMFRDIEIVPMIDNYDNSQKEPKHFLPLIPMVLINPQEGIAVGFACNIIGRDIKQMIDHQIDYLKSGKGPRNEAQPVFHPFDQRAVDFVLDRNGNTKWVFRGTFEQKGATEIKITGLPYGISRDKFINKIEALVDDGTIITYTDNSRDKYNIDIKFKRGTLSKLDELGITRLVGLESAQSENVNVIDFDGHSVWSANYVDIIEGFTEWRLQWYITRYKRLSDLLEIDIQRLKDILLAIKKNLGSVARKIQDRTELKEYLQEIGIVHLDYIADLPVYRFTEKERIKAEDKLAEALETLTGYQALLADEDLRKAKYVEELLDIRQKIPAYLAGK